MKFEWDEHKNRINHIKHKVSFEVALEVFNDPLAVTVIDRVVDGEQRWKTTGLALNSCLLVVAHTYRKYGATETIRLISARRANAHERKAYEEG